MLELVLRLLQTECGFLSFGVIMYQLPILKLLHDVQSVSIPCLLWEWTCGFLSTRFVLNTKISMPHDDHITALCFNNAENYEKPILVTASRDGHFKVWVLTDDSDIYSKFIQIMLKNYSFKKWHIYICIYVLFEKVFSTLLSSINGCLISTTIFHVKFLHTFPPESGLGKWVGILCLLGAA